MSLNFKKMNNTVKIILFMLALIGVFAIVAGLYAFAAVFMLALKIAAFSVVVVGLGWLYFKSKKKKD